MILTRVRLRPFGCFTDREAAFSSGLNVVLGPNEAGKSTLFNAVKSAFLRSRLTKKESEEYMDRFLPASGGDSASVELSFTVLGEAYTLSRTWGPHPASRLSLPGGGALSTDEGIKERLEQLLPAKQGTLVRVLMAAQSEIVPDWSELKRSGSLTELDDIVRRTVLQTGGVSVESFKRLLDERHGKAFSHWDARRNLPEGGRGIEKPWEKQVGEILRASYDAETLRLRLEKARAHEKALDEVNGRLREASVREAQLRSFLDSNRKAVGDARERRTLEGKIDLARARRTALVRVGTEWPVADHTMAQLEREIHRLTDERASLARAREEAVREEENRKLREKQTRVGPKAERVRSALARVSAAPSLSRGDRDAIRTAVDAVRGLETGLEAGKLSVTLTARTAVELGVQVDFSGENAKRLGAGESVVLSAGGRIRVSHPELDVEVSSGDVSFKDLQEKLAEARAARDTLFSAHSVGSLEDAERAWAANDAAAAELREAEKGLSEELGGESLAAFEARASSLGPAAEKPSLAEVSGRLSTVEAEIRHASAAHRELLAKVEGWKQTYGSLESLMDAQAGEKAAEMQASGGMSALVPLPAGYADAEAAVKDFEQREGELRKLSAATPELREQKVRLEERADPETAEEIEEQASAARARFHAALRRGAALEKIGALTRELLAGSDASAYGAVSAELGRRIMRLTASRYRRVDLDGALPLGLESESGTRLGWDLLSAGTRDVLALALRLTMASHFLGDAPGFIMMDDPLVDMDPVRQEAAAAAIAEFAAEKQVILFTCHPRHAELLRGNLIQL